MLTILKEYKEYSINNKILVFMDTPEQTPKKRGRKPKSQKPLNNENTLIVEDVVEPPAPKKRGRKPKLNKEEPVKTKKEQSMLVVNKLDSINQVAVEDKRPENVILHLPINRKVIDEVSNGCPGEEIKSIDFEDDAQWYSGINGEETYKVNEDINTKYQNIIETRKTDLDISKTRANGIRKPVDYTMMHFMECNKKKIWPERTNVYCFNCCHPFEHTPSALPYKYQNGIFHVYGNFCYPECAAAFNFHDVLSIGNANENYNLLNIMYKLAYKDPKYQVKIPAHRTCLKIFGGHYDIQDYRDTFNNHHVQENIIMPPVLSIIPLQEENNVIYYKHNATVRINNNKGYDGARKKKELVLKRMKPVVNKQNTLDNIIEMIKETN